MAAGKGALSGIRVVDFGQYIAGPLAAMFLADNGADVIHIDPPGGPRWQHSANATLQRGKRVINLDLKAPAGQAKARALIEGADVVIEGFRPGVMSRLGFAPDSFANRRLIWCSLPGFPADDDRAGVAGWEGVVSAATGLYPPDAESGAPVAHPLTLASNFAAFLAAHRIAAALVARLRYGCGQVIEVSLYEACFQAIGPHGEIPAARKTTNPIARWLHGGAMEPCRAADGTHVYFDSPARGVQAFLDRFLPGNDLLSEDSEMLGRLTGELQKLVSQRPGAEWERIGQEELHAAIGLVQPGLSWLRDRHALASGTVVEVDDPELGPTVQAGFSALLSLTPAAIRGPRQIISGAVDVEALTWLAPVREDPPWTAGTAGLPLEGIHVLDCSTLLAGPTAMRVLAQYGANVIKIEKAGVATGDINPLSDDPSALIGHRSVNAGKRMMFLDLGAPEGVEIVQAIAQRCDVVHHNFTPATAERLGLGRDAIRALNPAVIPATTSLHSRGGFRGEYRGHEPLAQMVTGLASRMGSDEHPHMSHLLMNDHACGHLTAFAILLALLHRHSSGEAQEVNGALSRTATLHQVPFLIAAAGPDGPLPIAAEPAADSALHRLYRAADGWLFVAGRRVDLQSVAALAGVAEVADADLERWLTARFTDRPVDDWVAELNSAGLGAHRAVTQIEAVTDDRAMSSNFAAVQEHPGMGLALGITHPLYGATGERGESLTARRPGMDSLDIAEQYGFGHRIAELLRNRVIATGENPVVATTTVPGYWVSNQHEPEIAAAIRHVAPRLTAARFLRG